MSDVPKSERPEANAAYVDAVVHMKEEIFITTRKWHKRWQSDAAADVNDAARSCHKAVVMANAIYAHTPGEYEDKIRWLNEAMGWRQYLNITLDELYYPSINK